MILCQVCGFRNPDQNVRCFKCNALIKDDPHEVRRAYSEADKKREWYPGLRLRGAFTRAFRNSRLFGLWRQTPDDLPHRFPFTAATLSLIPGLGQIYNQQWGKAAVLGMAWFAFAAFCLLTITHPYSNLLLLGLLFFWVLIWNDALVSAIRINGQFWTLRNTIAAWFALLFIAGLVLTALQWLFPALLIFVIITWSSAVTSMVASEAGHWSARQRGLIIFVALFFSVLAYVSWKSNRQRAFTFVRLMKSVHSPTLRRGDIIFVNNVSYWFSGPNRDEMVHCDPGSFTMEQTGALKSNTYAINVQDYFQRIVGTPGDIIEKSGRRITRNGRAISDSLLPVGVDFMPDGKWTVPEDRYFVPVTRIPFDVITGTVAGHPDAASQPGHVLKGWEEACMITEREIFGRAVAILNPPVRRQWLGP